MLYTRILAVVLKIKVGIIVGLFLLLECAFQMSDLTTLCSQNTETIPHRPVVLVIKLSLSETGDVTTIWEEAIRYLRRHQNVSVSFGKRQLSKEEILWANLIKRKILIWTSVIDSLRIPFRTVTPPDTVTILLGNQHGEDAFVYADSTICFSLNRLSQLYGSASELVNSNRIDRLFAHEFTHVLHKAWRKTNAVTLDSPLDDALWECLTEGLGNYRSLSSKWILHDGELTEHAKSVLIRLQPIFVQRISALDHATFEEADSLMESLSMGPFDQKWGALTIALWLAQEAKGDDSNLQKWVDKGLTSVLLLAQKYLPEELKGEMPVVTEE